MKRIKQKICGDWLFSHVKSFFCFKQSAERLTTVVKAIFVFTVKKSLQPLNSLLLEIHVPFATNLASIFLTFSVTRAMVSSVFRGQDDIEEGLLTCNDVELKCCCGEKRTLLLLFFNVCCCFFKVIFRYWTVQGPLIFGEIVGIEHLPLQTAIVASNMQTLVWV